MGAKKILVVDDNVFDAQFLERALKRSGYETLRGYSGKDALAIAEAADPDLVLLDVRMPDLDGFEACRILRERDEKAGRYTPIILITGLGDVASRVKGLDLGADDVVMKPFAIEELFARIRGLLRLRERLEASRGGA